MTDSIKMSNPTGNHVMIETGIRFVRSHSDDRLMAKFRFNIASLLGIVLFVAVGVAALRESSDLWESSIFSMTSGMLLISNLLTIHRTETRRAFWLGFALSGSAYLGLSLVPSIESRLITTKALHYLDSKVTRSSPAGAGLAYFDYDNDGAMDLYVVNNHYTNALFLNKGNGDWLEDVTAAAGSNGPGKQTWFRNILARRSLTGFGTTENFVRIGHSILTIVTALLGGQLSRHLDTKNRQAT